MEISSLRDYDLLAFINKLTKTIAKKSILHVMVIPNTKLALLIVLRQLTLLGVRSHFTYCFPQKQQQPDLLVFRNHTSLHLPFMVILLCLGVPSILVSFLPYLLYAVLIRCRIDTTLNDIFLPHSLVLRYLAFLR